MPLSRSRSLVLASVLGLGCSPELPAAAIHAPDGRVVGTVPVESPLLDSVQSDVQPSGEAVVAVRHGSEGGGSLYLVSPAGTRPLEVTSTPDEWFLEPRWAADGKRVAYVVRQPPSWVELGGERALAFRGRVHVRELSGPDSEIPGVADAAGVLGFSDRDTLWITRFLPGDLPETRPARVDLGTGAVEPLELGQGHFYNFALVGDRLYYARSPQAAVTAAAPSQLFEVVERPLSGPGERVVFRDVGVLPARMQGGPSSRELTFELDGVGGTMRVNLDSLERSAQPPPPRPPPSPAPPPAGLFSMPYIHQVYDTPDSFNGAWACGPTTSAMVLGHFSRLTPWPITASTPTPHTSLFGAYVADRYTAFGTTFNRVQNDASGYPAEGGYGWCTLNGAAWASRMQDYANHHNLVGAFEGSPTFAKLKAAVDSGKPIILSTYLTSVGHIVAVKGYTSTGSVVVNDPYGNKHAGYMNYLGETVTYSWAEVATPWWVTVAAPLPPYGASLTSTHYGATMHAGDTAPVTVTYRNTGSATWNGSTRLGTTVPQDRASPFYDPGSWLSPKRAANAPATAPGASATFSFTLRAPLVCATTTFQEHFNLVQEGTAWFSASGQGGPADNALLLSLTVEPPVGGCSDGGRVDAGSAVDAGPGAGHDAGTPDAGQPGDAGPGTPNHGPGPGGDAPPARAGGCAAGGNPMALAAFAALGWVAAFRRRRR